MRRGTSARPHREVYNHVATALLLEVVGEDVPLNEWDGEEGLGGGEEDLPQVRQVQVPEGIQGLFRGRVRVGVGHGDVARAV
jgi:hypothetical protein